MRTPGRLWSVAAERCALCRPSERRGADQEISGKLHAGPERVWFGASDPIRDREGLRSGRVKLRAE
jgi:hypothetical protein